MTFAFITSFAPSLNSSLRHTSVTSRPFILSSPPISRPRSLTPTATAKPPTASPPDEPPFTHTAQQILLALVGIYAALNDTPSALAVPEALVEAFKSKPASLGHPTIMWTIFATVLFTFYLGFQSSRVRSASPEERKQLVKGKFGERHFKISSALFAIMTLSTFTGMANTYARTGKLFPGPHLYAGLGLVGIMSVMSSFVPYMNRGKEWARTAHFSLALVVIGLFGWQAKSGMGIVSKLLGWDQ